MSSLVEKNTFSLQLAQDERDSWNAGFSLGLYQNSVSPTPNMQFSNFVECDYDGYARQALSFGPVFVGPNGLLSFVAQNQFDSVPGAGTTNVVRGVMVLTPATDPLLAGNLDTPIPMGALGEGLYNLMKNQAGQFTNENEPTL